MTTCVKNLVLHSFFLRKLFTATQSICLKLLEVEAQHFEPQYVHFIDAKAENGGERGIRTLGALARSTVFETVPFSHSGTSPTRHDLLRSMKRIKPCISCQSGFDSVDRLVFIRAFMSAPELAAAKVSFFEF